MKPWIPLAALALSPAFPAPSRAAPVHWVGSWAAAQQIPEPANALPPSDLRDATLRQVVHLSIGGPELRVRLSNVFGFAPLHLDSVRIALAVRPGSPQIEARTERRVLFDGQDGVWIPPGASYWSDPVDLPVAPLANLAVSIHFDEPPRGETSHPGSRSRSFLVPGNRTGAADLPGARVVEHWFQLSGIAVEAPADACAVVALGDSITDGHASTTDGNDRWPDWLADRLEAGGPHRPVGVLNLGIGGNRVLLYGLGPDALARFDRDVLGQPGATGVILLEGINDLGTLTRAREVPPAAHRALVGRIIGAYRQMIERAHERGIRVIGGTITPDDGNSYYHPDARDDADREAINAWIRAPGHFDAVADFDAALRDPKDPGRLSPAYDSGDHLHPSPVGYRRMAEVLSLTDLTR
jgi:lysophospholipase L1-like esterase